MQKKIFFFLPHLKAFVNLKIEIVVVLTNKQKEKRKRNARLVPKVAVARVWVRELGIFRIRGQVKCLEVLNSM